MATSIRLLLTALAVCGITFAAIGAPLPTIGDQPIRHAARHIADGGGADGGGRAAPHAETGLR